MGLFDKRAKQQTHDPQPTAQADAQESEQGVSTKESPKTSALNQIIARAEMKQSLQVAMEPTSMRASVKIPASNATGLSDSPMHAEPAPIPPESEASQARKKQTSAGRTHQIKTRLNERELEQFRRRVAKSGLAPSEFIRKAILNERIEIVERGFADIELLDEIAHLRAELGRQGGLLKMLIKPNEGQREITPNEWKELICLVREIQVSKKNLSELEVRITSGYYNT